MHAFHLPSTQNCSLRSAPSTDCLVRLAQSSHVTKPWTANSDWPKQSFTSTPAQRRRPLESSQREWSARRSRKKISRQVRELLNNGDARRIINMINRGNEKQARAELASMGLHALTTKEGMGRLSRLQVSVRAERRRRR